jgi:hypothetical protein
MCHANDHDRRQAEQERRRQIDQTAWLYHVPRDLAAIMSDEVLRLSEEYIQQEFPPSSDLRDRGDWWSRRKELMVVGLKYVTEARSTSEQERASWRAFWTKWDAKHAPPTRAERERSRRERDRYEALEKQRRESEMRDARDAFLEDMP